MLSLAELLHELGLIVYYGADEGLRDFVVLNPEWLTKAISFVLEDEPTRQAGGVLDHARLKEIWQDRADGTSYDVGCHPYFLRLMENPHIRGIDQLRAKGSDRYGGLPALR